MYPISFVIFAQFIGKFRNSNGFAWRESKRLLSCTHQGSIDMTQDIFLDHSMIFETNKSLTFVSGNDAKPEKEDLPFGKIFCDFLSGIDFYTVFKLKHLQIESVLVKKNTYDLTFKDHSWCIINRITEKPISWGNLYTREILS